MMSLTEFVLDKHLSAARQVRLGHHAQHVADLWSFARMAAIADDLATMSGRK